MSYRKGRNFEYQIIKLFSSAGYYTVRSAGSHGVFDILAVKDGIPFGIQCKLANNLSKCEKSAMLNAYKEFGIYPLYAYKINRTIYLDDLVRGKTIDLNELGDLPKIIKGGCNDGK